MVNRNALYLYRQEVSLGRDRKVGGEVNRKSFNMGMPKIYRIV